MSICKTATRATLLFAAPVLCFPVVQSAFAAAPTLASIYSFQGGADGSASSGGLVADPAGNLYGVTFDGGVAGCGQPRRPVYCGTVFELSPPALGQGQWTKVVLHTFTSFTGPDGAQPIGALAIDKSGILYGTAHIGGVSSHGSASGTAFSLTPPQVGSTTWTFTLLHTFTGIRGSTRGAGLPSSRLSLDKSGNLYGTTISGYQGATVFELVKPTDGEPDCTEQILYSFNASFSVGTGAVTPGLVADSSGNLYSYSLIFGSPNYANGVYRISPPMKKTQPWTYSDIVFFRGQNGIGYTPTGELSMDAAGAIYGTTKDGGPQTQQAGAAFVITPPLAGQTDWGADALHVFTSMGNTGAYPFSGLVTDKFGQLYGSTAGYATVNQPVRGATVFQLIPPAPGGTTWPWKKLAAFGGANGASPMSSLTIAPNGKLYGTTAAGGAYNYGTIFQVSR